jgi:glycosyltransferase involved in cell wall biosynthesis
LAQQTYPSDRFEVIVVDDGSTDETETVAEAVFAFALRYFRQRNQGDAAARNFGAQQSQAEFLVFLDDDILLEPGYLTHLIRAHDGQPNRIVVGTWNLWQAEATTFSRAINDSLPTGAYQARTASDQSAGHSRAPLPEVSPLPFRDAYSNNMSLRREAYLRLGMMQWLDFAGSSMWCDLDFAYRAYRQGYEFLRSTNAICWHRDHTARSLAVYKKRVRTAAYRAVALFRQYPDLITHVPMFHDKTPIVWRQDPPPLIARKLARAVASSRPALWSLEKCAGILEKRHPESVVLPALYRYIIGGHIFQGYREGLYARLER